MRLGLIGLGKQGQRYLELRNGGGNIAVTGSRSLGADLASVDGVLIATHPSAHAELALECIAARKPVLIEKPLALTLEDCERVIDAAGNALVPLEVAHTHLWASHWLPRIPSSKVRASAYYQSHDRDYSAWLDWGPHILALVAQIKPGASTEELRAAVHVGKSPNTRGVFASGEGWSYDGNKTDPADPSPMMRMIQSFMLRIGSSPKHWVERNQFNRRVYRALFHGANHGE